MPMLQAGFGCGITSPVFGQYSLVCSVHIEKVRATVVISVCLFLGWQCTDRLYLIRVERHICAQPAGRQHYGIVEQLPLTTASTHCPHHQFQAVVTTSK